jgi:regulator of protease activity HflC (stomatin/prohibitin superfamily)
MALTGWFIGTVGLILLLGCIFIPIKKIKEDRHGNVSETDGISKGVKISLGIGGIALGIVGLMLTVIVIVPLGNVGVVTRFGATTGTYLEQGLKSKSPIDKVILMNIQTQKFETDSTAASKDLQDVMTKVAINYKLSPSESVTVYRTIGKNYIEVIAHPAIQEIVKEITAKFNAEDMITRRAEVKEAISTALSSRLLERGIITEVVNITNFEFSDEFTKAIEAKVSQQQSLLQAQIKLEQIKIEAQQVEAAAVGQANAAIARANGEAQSIQIVTDAQVSANKKIEETLTDNVLQYIFIDRMGDEVKVWVVPQGQNITLGDVGK